MFDISKFKFADRIPDELLLRIKLFSVFDSSNGYNILFITEQDDVYGFGANSFGVLGVGNNQFIEEPCRINELCNKNIKQFYNGAEFAMAINNQSQVYCWGRNNCCQLAKENENNIDVYFKPGLIEYFEDKHIVNLSCGSGHSLALSSKGKVYSWGRNFEGQVGNGCSPIMHNYDYVNIDELIVKAPVELNFDDHTVKDIYCAFTRSFAITTNGFVYSWGGNKWHQLGHNIDKTARMLKPTKINISDIIAVNPSTTNTYFLNSLGYIYYCGLKSIDSEDFQIEPTLLSNDCGYESFVAAARYNEAMFIATTKRNNNIVILNFNEIFDTDYDNYFDYYCQVYDITFKCLNQRFENYIHRPLYYRKMDRSEIVISRYKMLFDELSLIGNGSFGAVYKAKKRNVDEYFAFKKIIINDITDENKRNIIRELTNIADIFNDKNKYIVRTYCWFMEVLYGATVFYLQMELCDDNLKNIMNNKHQAFERELNQMMSPLEYFISCELFNELLHCINSIHEMTPQMIHRDLKPQNFLICYNNNGNFLKICDLGLSVILKNTDSFNRPGAGTPRYRAPEVETGHYDVKSDIFSLGVIAQDLFDLDILDKDPMKLYTNGKFSHKVGHLAPIIKTMLTYPKYKLRPSCKQILDLSPNWTIMASSYNNISDVETRLKYFKEYNFTFYERYLQFLLNKPEHA